VPYENLESVRQLGKHGGGKGCTLGTCSSVVCVHRDGHRDGHTCTRERKMHCCIDRLLQRTCASPNPRPQLSTHNSTNSTNTASGLQARGQSRRHTHRPGAPTLHAAQAPPGMRVTAATQAQQRHTRAGMDPRRPRGTRSQSALRPSSRLDRLVGHQRTNGTRSTGLRQDQDTHATRRH